MIPCRAVVRAKAAMAKITGQPVGHLRRPEQADKAGEGTLGATIAPRPQASIWSETAGSSGRAVIGLR